MAKRIIRLLIVMALCGAVSVAYAQDPADYLNPDGTVNQEKLQADLAAGVISDPVAFAGRLAAAAPSQAAQIARMVASALPDQAAQIAASVARAVPAQAAAIAAAAAVGAGVDTPEGASGIAQAVINAVGVGDGSNDALANEIRESVANATGLSSDDVTTTVETTVETTAETTTVETTTTTTSTTSTSTTTTTSTTTETTVSPSA